MSGFTLRPVEHVSLGVHDSTWDQAGEQPRQRQPREQKFAARRRLLRAVVPERDPETCDVLGEFGPDGTLEAVVIRETATGAILAHLSLEQFARISADADHRGLLFERRG